MSGQHLPSAFRSLEVNDTISEFLQQNDEQDDGHLQKSAIVKKGLANNQNAGHGEDVVTLNVGGTIFQTRKSTLSESKYFTSHFSGRWAMTPTEHPIFIDLDPSLFSHALEWMRLNTMPALFTREHTMDVARYAALLEVTRFLGLDRLSEWIELKQFMHLKEEVITTQVTYHIHDKPLQDVAVETVPGGVELTILPTWSTVKRYYCPREISNHDGHPNKCGDLCRELLETHEISAYREVNILRVLRIKRVSNFRAFQADIGSANPQRF